MTDDADLVDASAIGGIVGGWDVCPPCGHVLQVGDWPICSGRGDHGRSVQLNAFAEYWDDGLGMWISSLGDRWKAMRAAHMDYRPKLTPGDLSARLDRIHEAKKAQARPE
jgi:hypothetical protein